LNYKYKIYNSYIKTTRTYLEDLSAVELRERLEKESKVFQDYYGDKLPENRHLKILEIGCGHGDFIHYLNNEGYLHVSGVDISKDQVALAKSMGIENVYRANFLDYLDEHSQQFDFIAALDVLEHFDKCEVFELLEKIYQALKEEGVFLLKVPNASSPFWGRIRFGDFTHELAFTKRSIQQVLLASNFKNIEVFSVEPVRSHSFFSLIRFYVWKILKLILRIYLIIETGSASRDVLSQNLIAKAKK
jgi:cyclopropane fatty-acyl-phospholipid synthase-like methyltransferase